MSKKPFTPIIPAPWQQVYIDYCHAPAVRVGNDIHLSGLIGYAMDGSVSDDFSVQVETIFASMEAILGEAGAGLADVFSLTSYHVGDLKAQMPDFMRIQVRWLGKPHPAWTAVGTTELALPGALVEVSAIARIAG